MQSYQSTRETCQPHLHRRSRFGMVRTKPSAAIFRYNSLSHMLEDKQLKTAQGGPPQTPFSCSYLFPTSNQNRLHISHRCSIAVKTSLWYRLRAVSSTNMAGFTNAHNNPPRSTAQAKHILVQSHEEEDSS